MTWSHLIVATWLVSAALAAFLAQAKGRSAGSWFFVGFLFGPLGLIAAAGMPERTREQRGQNYTMKYLVLATILLLAIALVVL